jgi:hypothetical protein
MKPANRVKGIGFLRSVALAFTNTFSEDEFGRSTNATQLRRRDGFSWGSSLANIHPVHDDTFVDYHNGARTPLRFLSRPLMPPTIRQSDGKHHKSTTIAEVKEIQGRAQLMPSQDGREEVDDDALQWATMNVLAPATSA